MKDEFFAALDKPFLWPLRIAAIGLFLLIAFGVAFAVIAENVA